MMTTDADLDARLTALLAEVAPPPDPAFADRIVTLARHDLTLRRARRRAIRRVVVETIALAAVVAAFVCLLACRPTRLALGIRSPFPVRRHLDWSCWRCGP